MNEIKAEIWVVEDEENIRDFLKRGLEDDGYCVYAFSSGEQVCSRLKDGALLPQLMLLDIKMGGMSGLDLCRMIRTRYGFSMPVIMLTALGTTDDIVAGLHAGADDYVVKPFSFLEVLARIESALRRFSGSPHHLLAYADLQVDVKAHRASRATKAFDLSVKELRLLAYLIQHHGEPLSRSRLLKDVWDRNFDTNTNVVDVYIRYLREKIDDGFPTKLIHTVVGVGYVLK